VSVTPGAAGEGPDGRPVKVCPDCAETVLVAARKCRFCGYRFDEPPRGPARSLLERLGLWRALRPVAFEELLADWGIELAEGETAACFRYVTLDAQVGYLLVTDLRLVFVADRRREQVAALEYPRARVENVHAARGGRHLTLEAGATRHVIAVGPGSSPRQVKQALEALARPVEGSRRACG